MSTSDTQVSVVTETSSAYDGPTRVGRSTLGWAGAALAVLLVSVAVAHLLRQPSGNTLATLVTGSFAAAGLALISVGAGYLAAEVTTVTTTTTTTSPPLAEGMRSLTSTTVVESQVLGRVESAFTKLTPARVLIFGGITLLLVAGAGAGLGYTFDQVRGAGAASVVTPTSEPSATG